MTSGTESNKPQATKRKRIQFQSPEAPAVLDAWIEAGWPMHPIIPPGATMHEASKIDPANVGKIPGRFTAGRNDWTGIKAWQKAPSGIATLANAVRSGGGGLGFLCTLVDGTGLLGVDIDCMDFARVKEVHVLALRHLGRSPVRIGRLPKSMLVYRRSFALPKTTHELDATNVVEMLADGQQFVAAGIHPKTLMPYSWRGALTTPGDLTEVTEEGIEAFLAALAGLGFKPVGKRREEPRSGLNGNGKGHDPADSLVPRLRLAGLRPTDAGGGKWLLTLCPWDEFHTDGRDDGAAYFEPGETNGGAGGFDCKHAHCREKGVGDVYEWLRVEESRLRTARFAKMKQDRAAGPAQEAPETAQEAPEPGEPTSGSQDEPEAAPEAPGEPGAETAPGGWPEPVDFWAGGDLPTLPKGVLPPAFDALAWHAHEVSGFDAGFVGMAAMTIAAASIRAGRMVQVRRNDSSWVEPAILWTMLYGPPSVKKSPVLKLLSKVTRRLNGKHADTHRSEMAEYMRRKKAAGKDPEALAAVGDPPVPKLVAVTDFTVEALSEVLKAEVNSDGRMAVLMDEGATFITPSGYTGGTDIPTKLKLYGGEGEWILRVKRGNVYVACWGTSFIGCSTPEAIADVTKRMPNNGLLQRFMWLEGVASEGSTTKGFDDTLLTAYEQIIEKLHKGENHTEVRYTFSPEAQTAVDTFFAGLRHLQRLVQFDEPRYAEALGKMEALFARLCLVSHCTGIDPPEVSLDTVERIRRLFVEYLMPQAARFHAATGGRSTTDLPATTSIRVAQAASAILRMEMESVTTTLLHQKLRFWREVAFMERLDILASLVGHGWIVPDQCEENGKTVDLSISRARMTGWSYSVNPLIHDGRFAKRRVHLQEAVDALVAARRSRSSGPAADDE